ncbi:MAG: ShlB/FhaC/HecB family hemolysin secretion/activation protein [Moraxellaceae bacterium]|nr:ShlB/FhaC/HecB family hemolysin secretion/activation protein [Moraxellaceae bacterium]
MKINIPIILFSTIGLSVSAYADTIPNAGSLSRQVDNQQQNLPQTINEINQPQSNISKDNTPIAISNIQLTGNRLLSQAQLQPLLDKYIGQTTTFGGLQQLSNQINHAYQQAGYPLVKVIIPPQRLENGEVKLLIVESKINKMDIDNKSRVADKVVKDYLNQQIKLGHTLNQQDSERALLLVKDLAGTSDVTYQLSGHKDGTALGANISSAPLADSYISLDNYGSKNTGKWRFHSGLNVNSPFGLGERISLKAMASGKGLDNFSINGNLPLGFNGVTLNSSINHTSYELGGEFKDLEATGRSNTINAGLKYPIIRTNKKNLAVSGTAQYKDLTDQYGATNTKTDKSLQSFTLGLNGSYRDNWLNGGYTQWKFENTIGNLSIDSADALAIDKASAKTDGKYYQVNGSIYRTQYLDPNFTLTGGLQGQWANKNLDSSEQIGFGGANAISAYNNNDVSADMGIIGNLELRYNINPNIAVSAFYDVGKAKLRKNPYTQADNDINLHGGGIGLYSQYKNLSLQSKVAWRTDDKLNKDDDKPEFWLSAGYRF